MRATTHSGVPPARRQGNNAASAKSCVMSAGSGLRALAVALLFVLLPIQAGASTQSSTAASGPVCRVTLSGSDSTNGSNWTDQSMDLQTALGTSDCSEIWVAAGVYTPTSTGDREVGFNVRSGVAVYGGFVGSESQRNERDWVAHLTTLSGDLAGDDGADFANNNENSYHVVLMIGAGIPVTASTILDGFAISGGNASSSMMYGQGAGLYCQSSECSPTISNVSFSSNSAFGYGGAMITVGGSGTSSPTLNNVTFSGNKSNRGGAMYNRASAGGISSPSLTNVTFSGNHARSEGGAIYTFGPSGTSKPSLVNVTFSGNSAGKYGGAMYNFSSDGTSSATLDNVILWGNTAPVGAQIYNLSATSTVKDSILQGTCPAGVTCTNVRDTDPLLGPLQDNGGSTQTMLPGVSSSAIDGGNLATCASTDQRGVVRPQGLSCDIGAVEVEIDRSTAGACRVDASIAAPGDGLSWATAYPDLQSALRDYSCSEVWVAAGVYTPVTPATLGAPTPAERGISFDVRANIEVYGGFAGDELQRSDRSLSVANASTLSGDLNNDDGADFANNSENSYHVVTMDGTQGTTITASTVLDGFSIRGGNAGSGSGSGSGNGGGLYCDGHGAGHDCSPQLRNLSFSGNYAEYGGAVYNNGHGGISSPNLTNVTFSGNKARDGGGAIFNWGQGGTSSPSLVNVTFHANSAAAYGGGAMLNWGADGTSSPILTNVTFSGNSASSGAAMVNFYYGVDFGNTHPILNNVILWGNHSDVGDASGISDAYGTVVNDSVVQGGCPPSATCSNVIDTDPLLGPLQDNGGSTQTMLPGAGGSAIDGGNDGTCHGTDQRGISRPQGPQCDIGAVEVESLALNISVSGAGHVNADSSPTPLSGAILTCTSASGEPCAANYAPGDSVTLTASADVGQRFDAWGGDCSDSAASTSASMTMDADKTCSATFVINTHTVTGSVGSGQGAITPLTQSVIDGNSADLTVTADPHWHIASVSGCNGLLTGTLYTTGEITADCDVVANFAINTYTVGGNVSGLIGSDLVLRLNGSDPVLLTQNGSFVFAHALDDLSAYAVSIAQQPTSPNQVCSITDGSGMLDGSDISNVAIICADTTPQLSVSVTDNSDYARYGKLINYLVTVSNDGNGDATDIRVSNLSPPQLDTPFTSWTCNATGGGAICGSGTGALDDSGISIPIGRSLTWLVTVPVLTDAAGNSVDYTVDVSGPATAGATDSDILVILRTGFDMPYGNGAENIIAPVGACLASSISDRFDLASTYNVMLDATPAGALIDSVFVARDSHAIGFRIERLNLDAIAQIRIVTTDANGVERASEWASTSAGSVLAIATVTAGGQSVLLVEGADTSLSLPLPQAMGANVTVWDPATICD